MRLISSRLTILAVLLAACAGANPPSIQGAPTSVRVMGRSTQAPLGTPIVAIRPAPTPTITPTPRPPFDTPGAELGLVAELGWGMPWVVAWDAEGTGLRVGSVMGMRTIWKDADSWQERATLPAMLSDAFQFTGHLSRFYFSPPDPCPFLGIDPPAAISHDGKVLAYQRENLRIAIWDLSIGQLISETEALDWGAEIGFSASGTMVLAMSAREGLHVYDVSSGERLGVLVDRNAQEVIPSTTEDEALTVSQYAVQRWDLRSRRVLEVWPRAGSFSDARPIALNRGTAIAIDYNTVWWLGAKGEVDSFPLAPFYVSNAYLAPSGERLALWGSYRGENLLALVDPVRKTELRRIGIERPLDALLSLRFAPAEGKAAARLCTGELLELDFDTGEQRPIIGLPFSSGISDLAFDPTGRLLAVASPGWPVRVWDTTTAQLAREIAPGGFALAFSADGERLAVASDQVVRIWRLDEDQPELEIDSETGVDKVAFRDDDNLVGASKDALLVWETTVGGEVTRIPLGLTYASVLPSPGGEIVLVHSYPNVLDVYETTQGHYLRTIILPDAPLAISPDLREIASAHWDGVVQLSDLQGGEELRSFRIPLAAVYDAAYSHDGRLLVLGGANDFRLGGNVVVLAQPLNALVVGVLEGQTGLVTAVAVSPRGDLIATGASDGTVRLWGVVP